MFYHYYFYFFMYFLFDLIIGSRFLIFHGIAWHVHVVYSAMHMFLGFL